MRVYLLLSDVNPGLPLFAGRMLSESPQYIVGVGRVGLPPVRSRLRWIRQQFAFWGLRGSARIASRVLLQHVAGTFGTGGAEMDLLHLCKRHRVPTAAVRDPNAPDFVAWLKHLDVDVLVSFQPWILRQPLLDVAKRAALNVHTGLLPGFRGLRPLFWMMNAGLPELAVTIHTMTPAIDAGRVVHVERFTPEAGSTVMDNNQRAYSVAADALLAALRQVDAGEHLSGEIIPDESPYFRHPTRSEVEAARRRGVRPC